MNIWILTIGSSDVQLDSNSLSKKKGRTENNNYSDKIWNYWYTDELKTDYNLPSSAAPTRTFSDKDELYRIAPRILGTVYRNSSESCQQEILTYLTFPLLDNFVVQLKDKNLNNPEAYPLPDAIVLLLTDQSAILSDYQQRRKSNSPYWQDTCELEPILRHYLNQEFPNISCETIFLNPTETGLDNWDAVLTLVRDKFKNLNINDRKVEISTEENVYVSHQAGTPAISSAVQFSSLGKFGDRVRFLVSNEYNPELTDFVPSSSYLLGIKREQAKELLKNYDYAGVDQLVGNDLQGEDRTLLKASLKWNVAKFFNPQNNESSLSDPSFLEVLEKHPNFVSEVVERTTGANWWWIAYEEVYLAVIRKNQGNIVEAFFHSFRAFEYIFFEWCKQEISPYIEWIKGVPYLSPSILDDPNNYFSNKRCNDISDFKRIKLQLEELKKKLPEEIKNEDRVKLDMATVCKIFRAFRYKEYKQHCEHLKIFWDTSATAINVSNKRNFIVHQVQGMSESDLWNFWDTSTPEEWADRLLDFLNFIAKKEFVDLEQASLMAQVHQELTQAIDSL